MSVTTREERRNDTTTVKPSGIFDVLHARAVANSLAELEQQLGSSRTIDVDLAAIERFDGSGAALLADFLDRLEAGGRTVRLITERNPEVARLIAFYRERHDARSPPRPTPSFLEKLGAAVLLTPTALYQALDFIGRCAVAIATVVAKPRSADWHSFPRVFDHIGASSLFVTSAANLLVGLIIGVIGVSQLGRFGATSFVPELVVIATFRSLGPLVTAMVIAGRCGAGITAELATMKVTEEVDALRAMGFNPIQWLVVPRCLALVISLPLLTWVGSATSLLGGWIAVTTLTATPSRTYFESTFAAITAADVLGGLAKTPFLGLAIGLIACGQGLATRGGAAAVGNRTTDAVVLAIFGVIVIDTFFTVTYTLIGI